MFDFLLCWWCVFTFFVQNTLFFTKCCNIFCNINLFSIRNILQDLWPSVRVYEKMLCLYPWTRIVHLTFKLYLSSEPYSRKNEKLPNIVTHACYSITENSVACKSDWVCLCFDKLRWNSSIAWLQSMCSVASLARR